MDALNGHLCADSPIEVVESRPLFGSAAIRQRGCGSLVRLDSGRLLLAFRMGTGPQRRNDGAMLLSYSDDDGRSWDEPYPIYVHPGWDCLPMGGLVRFSDEAIRLIVGRIKFDPSLGGDEPMSDWCVTSLESRDGGATWSELGPEIRLFPGWTELYGASNPHPLADGRYLLACMGTLGRDRDWRAGVTVSDGRGHELSAPVIIAAAPDRNFSDIDLVRLTDGRFLAVIREHVTRQSFFAHSADEGRTWSPVRPTGFKGANVKLLYLRSGAVLCAYRDEDPARRGLSCSVSEDGGETWRWLGRLYSADASVVHRPGLLCGYPDMLRTGSNDLVGVLHTYPDAAGRVDLFFLRLKDSSLGDLSRFPATVRSERDVDLS
jgi:hypothetical protein